jgi:CDP-paratose 2-epimerase
LLELTAICRERTGRQLSIGSVPETNEADVPYYITDNRQFTARSGWAPRRSVDALVDDVVAWLQAQRAMLEPLLGPQPPTPVTSTP